MLYIPLNDERWRVLCNATKSKYILLDFISSSLWIPGQEFDCTFKIGTYLLKSKTVRWRITSLPLDTVGFIVWIYLRACLCSPWLMKASIIFECCHDTGFAVAGWNRRSKPLCKNDNKNWWIKYNALHSGKKKKRQYTKPTQIKIKPV